MEIVKMSQQRSMIQRENEEPLKEWWSSSEEDNFLDNQKEALIKVWKIQRPTSPHQSLPLDNTQINLCMQIILGQGKWNETYNESYLVTLEGS